MFRNLSRLSLPFCVLLSSPLAAETWTNALGNNDFANWANWVLDNTTENPTSWTAASQNWQVNLAGEDRAVLGPGQSVVGLDRNVLVGDAESAPVGSVGELLIDGGTLAITRNVRIGRDNGPGSGMVTVDGGGRLELGYGLYIGQSANAGSSFNLIDGIVEVTTNAGRSDGLLVGHRAEGNGTLNITGGQLNVKRGDAEFSAGGNAGAADSALNLSGDGALNVESGRITFGGNAGVSVSVSIADAASLSASNARFGFGADNTVSFTMSGGTLDISNGFIGFGQGTGSDVSVSMSGGNIFADRMGLANNETATATFDMTGGTLLLARTTGTATHSGGLRMQSAGAMASFGGTAVVNTEKLFINDGGLLILSDDASIRVEGSTDEANPTFDFSAAYLSSDWSTVLGRIVVNGGSFVVAGESDTVDSSVNYVSLLNAAISAGIIYTEVEEAELVVTYDTDADVTRLHLLTDDPPQVVSIWIDVIADETGLKDTGIGLVMDDFYPFVYHVPAGWFSVHTNGASLDGFHAYDFTAECWVWSADFAAGWRYNFNTESWEPW